MSLERLTPLGIALACLAGSAHADDHLSKLQVHGFATAGASWASEDFGGLYLGDGFKPSAGIDTHGTFNQDNVLGIQLAYAVDEKVDLVGQLVATGQDDYTTRADWAYISYRINDKLRIRGGRFAAPFYMFSETLRVGQSYPWARPPVELYNTVPVPSNDGVDLLYRQPLGDWNLDAQLTAGGFADEDYGKDKNGVGLNLTFSNSELTLHAGYSQSQLDLKFNKNPYGSPAEQASYKLNEFGGVTLDTKNADASFADAGAIYDNGTWLAMAEYGQLRIEGYNSDVNAGHITLGRYFGKWLPYVMFSKANIVNADDCHAELDKAVPTAIGKFIAGDITFDDLAFVAGTTFVTCQGKEQTSYSAGFRYDATKNVSLKLELDHVTRFNNTPGYFSGMTEAQGGTLPASLGGGASPVTLGRDESVNVLTFNVNAAF